MQKLQTIPLIAFLFFSAFILFSTLGCQEESFDAQDGVKIDEELEAVGLGDFVTEHYRGDLENILQKNLLRVITSKNSFDYFIHNGKHGGYQYEMVKAFVDTLNQKYRKGKGIPDIKFVLLPVRSELMIPMLLEGKGDLIAARLTITDQRKKRVRFTVPYRTVDEKIVVHADSKSIDSLDDLSGMEITVRESTSYFESLGLMNRQLEKEELAPINIHKADEFLETESLLALVASKRYFASVADSIVASTAVSLYAELKVVSSVPLRKEGKLAWAVAPNNVSLQKTLNEFLPRYQQGTLLGNMAVKKYFQNSRQIKVMTGLLDDDSERRSLSVYDALFQKYANQYGFDWRLMAALSYQESGFKQSAFNRSGATGLFQIKPQTAAESYINIPNIKGRSNAENNVHAGIKYLSWIKGRYFDPIEGMREPDRIRMALAAYNTGPRTLLRARAQSKAMGLNPNIWFHNVELVLLAMRKTEPVKYVSDINQHYLSYILLGIE